MERTGLTANRISSDMPAITLEDITSLTVDNYGENALEVIINDVPITVPAFNPAMNVPFGSFNLPGDGTACSFSIAIRFTGGVGSAVLYYRKLKQC